MEGGAALVRHIAQHIRMCTNDVVVVGTAHAHVDPGTHFAAIGDTPNFVDTWPQHCVVGTRGAAVHPNLDPALGRIEAWFAKGSHQAAASGFEGHSTSSEETLDQYLRRRRVNALDVVGIATEYCVAATVRSALVLGYSVRVLTDLIAARDGAHGERTLAQLESEGASVVRAAVIPL